MSQSGAKAARRQTSEYGTASDKRAGEPCTERDYFRYSLEEAKDVGHVLAAALRWYILSTGNFAALPRIIHRVRMSHAIGYDAGFLVTYRMLEALTQDVPPELPGADRWKEICRDKAIRGMTAGDVRTQGLKDELEAEFEDVAHILTGELPFDPPVARVIPFEAFDRCAADQRYWFAGRIELVDEVSVKPHLAIFPRLERRTLKPEEDIKRLVAGRKAASEAITKGREAFRVSVGKAVEARRPRRWTDPEAWATIDLQDVFEAWAAQMADTLTAEGNKEGVKGHRSAFVVTEDDLLKAMPETRTSPGPASLCGSGLKGFLKKSAVGGAVGGVAGAALRVGGPAVLVSNAGLAAAATYALPVGMVVGVILGVGFWRWHRISRDRLLETYVQRNLKIAADLEQAAEAVFNERFATFVDERTTSQNIQEQALLDEFAVKAIRRLLSHARRMPAASGVKAYAALPMSRAPH